MARPTGLCASAQQCAEEGGLAMYRERGMNAMPPVKDVIVTTHKFCVRLLYSYMGRCLTRQSTTVRSTWLHFRMYEIASSRWDEIVESEFRHQIDVEGRVTTRAAVEEIMHRVLILVEI